MLSTILSAGAVLSVEAAVRKKLNDMPATAFPRDLTKHIRIRRAHNHGIVGSRFEDKPVVATTVQTVATVVAVGAAVLVNLPGTRAPLYGRIGAGLLVGGAIANTAERYIKQEITDYVYLHDSRIPLLRRRIWNIADAAIFNGAVLAAVGLVFAE